MNWTQFLISLAAAYLFYYVLNVLYDLFRAGGNGQTETDQDELVFSEENTAQPVGEETADPAEAAPTRQVISSGPLQSTGAVSLKQLFSLAQSDLIECTKAIPY